MKIQLVSKVFPILCWILSNPVYSQVQLHIGPEIGTAISAIVPSDQNIPEYDQRISPRLGLFVETAFHELFAFRSGLFYSLRGFNFGKTNNTYNNAEFWDLHCLTLPLMAVFKPSTKVQIALGIELNSPVSSNLPLIRIPSFLVGIRGECGFHVTRQLRIAAYYTHTINKLLEIHPPNVKKEGFYNNIIAGISMSYVLKTFPSKLKKANKSCPPYL